MARLVLGAYTPPDPEKLAPGKAIRATDFYTLGMAINKLIADPGPPCISQGWSDGQFQCGGARTLRWTQRIPEWSARHTAGRLRCRVRTAAFGGAGAGVRFKSVNTGNTCDLTPGAGAGWTESVAAAGANRDLLCSFGPGYDTIEVYVTTAAGNLTIDVLQAEWIELASPLATGSTGDVVALDEDEFDVERPVSSRLGVVLLENLRKVEERVQVYLGASGLAGISYSGRAIDGLPPARLEVSAVPVHRGTTVGDWNLQYHAYGGNAGAGRQLDLDSTGREVDHVVWAAGAPSWKSGAIQLNEMIRDVPNIPHPWVRLAGTPTNDAPTDVFSLVMWGR